MSEPRSHRSGPLRQRRGLIVTRQIAAPEQVRLVAILRGEPTDIVPVRYAGRKPRRAVIERCRVEFQEIALQDGQAPAIDQNVMIAPDEVILTFTFTEQSHANQRPFREIEASTPILDAEFVEARCLTGC